MRSSQVVFIDKCTIRAQIRITRWGRINRDARTGYNRQIQNGTVRVAIIIGDRIGDALGQGGTACEINTVRRIKRPGSIAVQREGPVLRINSRTDRSGLGRPVLIGIGETGDFQGRAIIIGTDRIIGQDIARQRVIYLRLAAIVVHRNGHIIHDFNSKALADRHI